MNEQSLLNTLLYIMLTIRMVEEKIGELYHEQEMRCPVHLCIGQEAVAVGVCTNLTSDDSVFSTHRSHGHYLAKGGNLPKMLAEIYGKETGCSHGNGGSMHLIDQAAGFLGSTSIVGGTISVATGVAFANKMMNKNHVTVAFLGDAATEEGVFSESINFAVLHKLPIVFVCENNSYSVYSPLSVRQPAREIYSMVQGYGILSMQDDGNDVIGVYNSSRKAIEKARNGEGPVFIEYKTYRWREHCGPNYDNNIGYRDEAEFEQWRLRCPIDMLFHYMKQYKFIDNEQIENMTKQIEKEISSAFTYAKESPFPSEEQLFKHIYAGG